MKNSLFPKTGWFYLWLVLASLVLWGDRNRAWNSLESLNLNIWSRLKQPIDSSTPLVRLIVPSSKTIKELSKLVVDYPLATFSVISEKMDFDQLRQQPEIYNRLTIYSKSHSSIRSIGKASPLDLLDQPQVKWLADARLDIAFHDSTSVNQVAVLWSANKSIYPAFIAHLLAKYFDPKQEGTTGYSELSFSANLLTINNRITRVGIDGAILPLEQNIGAISLSQLNQQFDKSFSGIILLDDLSSTQGKKITNGLASLLSDGYFVTATSTYLVELILYLTLALLVWKAWWKPLLFQIIFVVCFITVCLLLQILLAGEELWLSIKVYLILSVCSLFVFIGSYFERRKEVNFSKRLTELLSLSAPVFYQNESMEKLLPLLLHSNPDRTLIDNISQLAIKAESENKLMLSEKLYLWLAKNQWNSSPTQQNIEKQDSEFGIEQLDKTMVIKTDGKTFAPKVGGILSVKNFGRYQIEGILGKGAMGIVFQGVDPKINRYVAIKTLQLNDEMDGESMAESKSRFFREAETAGNLSHANIVTIYDVGEQQQDSEHSLGYIAMDLLTGAPLSEFIKQGKLLPSALVYQLMIQMTDALEYAHRQKSFIEI